ncbi:hypothetical protein TD95_004999 [Thielaviopsis punctulata]|uniref:RRM domain-containing protein n=1 Tax=Thielaviopsis punctulata TaxID=72032 RepID=A0A0F4ZAZ3_9PEZI|nr:hypothetical protein TD95_004999 [Thielaviopsis punctulata]
MTEVSSTRFCPDAATKEDVQSHFARMAGQITEIKLMNGFGFIEYKDPMDARDVVPDGSDFMGERLTVQFARGARHRDNPSYGPGDRPVPRPRRTPHRMQISGLPGETSWQDLKDFARGSGLDVIYSETARDRPGQGFVEFDSDADLRAAVEKLHNKEFKGNHVTCVADPQPDFPMGMSRDPRKRSRSPMMRRPYGRSGMGPVMGPGPHAHHSHHGDHEYDRRGPMPPRGYSPHRDDYRIQYRDRSPRRPYYDDRHGYPSPPRRGPMMDDYGRRPYDDPYRREYTHAPPPDPYSRPPPVYGNRPPKDYQPRDGYSREPYPPRSYNRNAGYW